MCVQVSGNAALMEELGNPTEDDFLWAHAVRQSRAHGGDIDGHTSSMLVPYADLTNHRAPSNAVRNEHNTKP